VADALFELGRNGFLDGTLDFDTQTFSAALLDFGTADVGIKAITGATNATPIVITATAHGFTNGDIVSITGVAGNLAANGLWAIAGVAANTFQLTDPITAGNSTGSGAYTSGGFAVNYGPSASGDNWDDFDGALVGAKVNLAGNTATAGVADANDVTFTSVSGNTVEGVAIFRDTGTTTTSRMVAMIDGHQIVTCAAAPTGTYTTLAVERLRGGIANGTVLAFSNGSLITTNATANAGDRTLTVVSTAVAVTAGSRADAAISGAGLPVTPNGGNITLTFDSGVNRIFRL
jgi:hypothetical protein